MRTQRFSQRAHLDLDAVAGSGQFRQAPPPFTQNPHSMRLV